MKAAHPEQQVRTTGMSWQSHLQNKAGAEAETQQLTSTHSTGGEGGSALACQVDRDPAAEEADGSVAHGAAVQEEPVCPAKEVREHGAVCAPGAGLGTGETLVLCWEGC